MTAETHSRQMQNLISSLEHVAIRKKHDKREPKLFNLDVHECYVCCHRRNMSCYTSQIYSNSVEKV